MTEASAHFADGRPYMVTHRRELPSGNLELELVTRGGIRRRLWLAPYEASDVALAGIAEALDANRRIVKGQAVGQPPAG